MKAKFKIGFIKPDDYIYIIDKAVEYECMSITNDAEAVVENILQKYNDMLNFNIKHIYYKDCDNQIDELLFEDGKFITFKFGHSIPAQILDTIKEE